jgi:hypothetical protein
MRLPLLLAGLLILSVLCVLAPGASAATPPCTPSNTGVNTQPDVYTTPDDGQVHVRGHAFEICGQWTDWHVDV